MQQWHQAVGALIIIINIGGGVTKAQDPSGISQFWTDDYKVYDQIYGKTSDKEIFGATLPPSLSFSLEDASKFINLASDKKERYIDSDPNTDNSNLDIEQTDPYGYGSRFNNLLTKQSLKKFTLTTKKPSKAPFKFISTNFKPITQENDPATYKYLQHLELLQKEKSEYPKLTTAGGFKPYLSYAGPNPEDTAAYKSIQDILDAHEANKGKNDEVSDDQVKYLTYGNSKGGKNGSRSNKKPIVTPPSYKTYSNRCIYGRCRKRATKTYRVGTRPHVRRIKHKIISY